MKRTISLLLITCITLSVTAQQKIRYGKNAAAAKSYSIRGINIYTEQYGSGKPLLLLHGNGGNMSAFSGIIPYFANYYRVIAVDNRAHGKSTDPGDSLSFEMMADDNAALLDAMHLDSAYVIGWSDGGITAIEMAMRHPDKVIRFASTGANLWPDSTALLPAVWKDEKNYFDSLQHKIWTTPQEKNNWKIFMLDWLQPNIPLAALQKIQCPSLIISGDHDLINLEHTITIYRNIPKANLWILPNSSHGTLIEYPAEFCSKVDGFFRKGMK